MERYIASDSIRTLVEELRRDGFVSKRRMMRDGSVRGGVPFKRGALAWLLSNRVYVGETVHKGISYPGEHDAIVSHELFDAVQAKLADRTARADGMLRRRVSLLAGMIRDEHDRPMSPCHTSNHGGRYAYYASSMNDDPTIPALRLPAGELELSVRTEIATWLHDGERIRELATGQVAGDVTRLFKSCSDLATRILTAPVAEARAILDKLALVVSVKAKSASASFSLAALSTLAGLQNIVEQRVSIAIPTNQAIYGHEPRLRLEPSGSDSISRDERLLELLARAIAAREQLLNLEQHQLETLQVTKLRHLQRTARISYLDPAIIRSILSGTQPAQLNARALWRMRDLSLDWADQRQALGITTIQP